MSSYSLLQTWLASCNLSADKKLHAIFCFLYLENEEQLQINLVSSKNLKL
jgi:hypothetical protein